jgi:Asp-tRNA(Asn)/Glu-tRNA(Gln) amidotransferase B subunit
VCAAVIAENPQQVEAYRGGKTGLIGWFVGQAMKKSRGQADAQQVRALFDELLAE